MKKTLFLLIFYTSVQFLVAQSLIQLELDKLKKDPHLASATWGFYALNLSNNKIEAEHNAQINLVPASVMKSITTATALELLGPEFKYSTKIYIRGEISSEGILNGDLIIRGGGDPTLGSEANSGRCESCIVNEVITMLQKQGIRLIAGDILADDSYFEAKMTPGGWNFSDIGNRYGASPSGLSFSDNTLWFIFQSGRDGSKAEYKTVRPFIPGMTVFSDVYAGGAGDNAYVFGAEYSNHRYISGSITPNKSNFEVKASMPDPPYVLAYTFYRLLNENGIYVTGLPHNTTQSRIPVNYNDPLIKQIGAFASPRLQDIISVTNKTSNNLYAEHLHKTLSAVRKGIGQNAASNDIINKFWVEKGVQDPQFFITDGSGLSRSNAMSPAAIVQVFKVMNQSKYKKEYYESMSIAGVDGTLKNLCIGTKAANNVHAKSGTMSRIKAYAGYVDTRSGQRIAFCIIANNYSCSTSTVVDKMERLMVKMAEMP